MTIASDDVYDAVGAHLLAADHGGRTRTEVLARATDLLFDRAGT